MKNRQLYDPSCERLDVAIKAIWRLYRFGKWDLLASIGMPRNEFESLLGAFDEAHIVSDHGLLTETSQVFALLRWVGPVLVERAMELVERYMLLMREEGAA